MQTPIVSRPLATLLCLSLALLSGCSSGGGGGNPTVSSADIGPGGGQISSADGVVTLVIPAGALATTETITITKLADADLLAGLQGFGPDQAYRFEPDGLQFALPANLSFSLGAPDTTTTGVLGADLPAFVGESAGVLETLDNSELEVTQSSQILSAPITHFSDYATKTEPGVLAEVRVTYPVSLDVGQQGSVGLDFLLPGMGAFLDLWTYALTGLNGDNTNFDDESLTTSFGINCQSGVDGTGVVEAAYSIPDEKGGATFHCIRVNFLVGCVATGGVGFDQDTFLGLESLGYSKPEAVYVPNWCGGTTLVMWVGTAEGGILIDPLLGIIVDFFLTNGNLFDVVPIDNGELTTEFAGPELGLIANGAGVGEAHSYDEASCSALPGLFLVDTHEDITQVAQDPSLGIVGASNFSRVSLFRLDPAQGGLVFDGFNTASLMTTVVSNATRDHLLGVTKFSRQLVLLDPSTDPATETFVANLGTIPRRMRWDPTSGIGAISDFADNTLTIFHWDGTANLPTIIDSVPVGDGPVGVDVFGGLVVCAGFNDDSYSLISVDAAGLTITSATTQPIPFSDPGGGPLQPGHAYFIRDANNTIGFSFFAADALGFTPFAF